MATTFSSGTAYLCSFAKARANECKEKSRDDSCRIDNPGLPCLQWAIGPFGRQGWCKIAKRADKCLP